MKYQVNIQEDLILQLARKQKKTPPPPQVSKFLPSQQESVGNEGYGRIGGVEMTDLVEQDKDLIQALYVRDQVGNLLLKREVQDLQSIQTMADNMIKRHAKKEVKVPCKAEESKLVNCLKEFKNDALKCNPLMQAYKKCGESLLR
eukprot:TRINITY_DN3908_c0_g2_i1.p3 TRINITY_DN3908_c0_g2~~TRINITY_DN3908_c0_g2_i1.p3  ORF type:complete len:145 (-),score=30.67 TRINITY_DN3908_c0_g2_i1:308-742(-)